MKSALIATLVLALGLAAAPLAHADTLAYPSADAASFVIDYPSSWEMTPGDSVGDYTTLTGTAGSLLMFRTIEGTEADLKQAVQDSIEYVQANYKDVALGEVTESKQRGLDGFYLGGNATDADLGKVGLGMAWYALKDGTIGEIWFVAPADDADGISEATAILDSFRSP